MKKKITIHTLVILSLGLSGALAQEESPSMTETRAGAGSPVSSPHPEGTKKTKRPATGPDTANGSVEVEVKVKEYMIDMPLSIAAGATTFKVTNIGKEAHGFEIEGNGMEKQITPRLKEGESGSLRVDLKPGTYQVYCPVKGHKMLGMSLELTAK